MSLIKLVIYTKIIKRNLIKKHSVLKLTFHNIFYFFTFYNLKTFYIKYKLLSFTQFLT